jgi:hypothetical protein
LDLKSHRVVSLTFALALLAAAGLSANVPLAQNAPAASVADEGSFNVLVGGQPVGTEKFRIRDQRDRIEAESQSDLRVVQDGQRQEFQVTAKLTMASDLRPLTYSWSQKGPYNSKIDADFRSSPAKLRYKTISGETDDREFELPQTTVILDDNVLHHYQLVVALYRRTAGGRQAFQAFVPQGALPGVLIVESQGKEQVDFGSGPRQLERLAVSTDLLQIEVWVDEQGRVQRLRAPAANLEAVRQ